MRRLTPRYKNWLMLRARNAARRRGVRRIWRTALIATSFGTRLVNVRESGALPSVLCLDNAYNDTVGFIYDLRIRTGRTPPAAIQRHMLRHGGRIGWVRNYQDFRSLNEISPGAALLMAAEYDRARTIGGYPLATVDPDGWNPAVHATLSMLGFFDLLDLPQQDTPSEFEGFHIQRLASEMAANSQPALDRVIALFEKAGGEARLRLALCGAVVDALENVRDHAYPSDHFFKVRHVPNWWFTGAANRDNRSLILAVYDQGITIPVSLPRRFGMDRVVSAFRRWFDLPFDPADPKHDGPALEAAMQLSATSTSEHYRGKGLAKIRDVVRECEGGRLRIVSRSGEYLFDGSKTWSKTHDVTLPGTYVEIAASF
jgi:hypothetical protein